MIPTISCPMSAQTSNTTDLETTSPMKGTRLHTTLIKIVFEIERFKNKKLPNIIEFIDLRTPTFEKSSKPLQISSR